jgi:hypothetical protein
MARAALAAGARIDSGTDEDFCRAKIATVRFYAEQILPKATALLRPTPRTLVGKYSVSTNSASIGIRVRSDADIQSGYTNEWINDAARSDGIRCADRSRAPHGAWL